MLQSNPFRFLLGLCLIAASGFAVAQAGKPAIAPAAITLDEYLNTTEITAAQLSPDGAAAVIATEAPDWKANHFRHVLWLWSAPEGLRPLTQSGTDENPKWSPDGKWIAFLSDRDLTGGPDADDADEAASGDAKAAPVARKAGDADETTTRIWVISVAGGEAQPLYTERLDAHSFAWSADGKRIDFSVTEPLTTEQEDALKADWKDVIRWREQERGDVLLAIPIEAALHLDKAVPMPHPAKKKDDRSPLPPDAATIAHSKLEIDDITPSPDGKQIAFLTNSFSHRMENPSEIEIYSVPAQGGEVKQLTHNQALEDGLRWSSDSAALDFIVHAAGGSLEGPYQDVQGRLYRLDAASGKTTRLGSDFTGSFENFIRMPDGTEIALGLKGTAEQLYRVDGDQAIALPGRAGSYSALSAPGSGHALLVQQSSINHPAQAYLAADALHPDQLTALTHFNPIFGERAQPTWRTYRWKAPDGVEVEGVLIYPPGKENAKHLRMLTFIHGGPADADGDRFGADWYDWATLAAAKGWLVFRPNYRGSTGYGDTFMLGIRPHLVSKPGEDILAGVDALVGEGIADPDKLAVGGYSYGGYMTNWLITATTRFKVAVTGAGAVEHAANWGNDDVTYDDAWYLNGAPWQNPALYQSEAALFRMDRVRTPTHIVQGNHDVRVSYLEGVTLERALQQLDIPHSFLVFPGEGHGLGNNPWHGYIKLREELLWLDKYDPE